MLDPLLPVTKDGVLFGPRLVPRGRERSYTLANRVAFELSFDLRDDQAGGRSEKLLFVRCVRLDGNSTSHSWPLYGLLYFNGKAIESFQFPKDLVSCKRKDTPKQLPPNLCLAGTNRILILRSTSQRSLNDRQKALLREDELNAYVFAVVEVENLSVEQLVSRVVATSRVGLQEARKEFMERVERQLGSSLEDDCICDESSLSVPCSDPYLPNTVMSIPAFGVNCRHVQRFDLRRFVQMNERARLWKCPYCNQKLLELRVDSYYEALLAAVRPLNLRHLEVSVDRSGKFSINNLYKATFEGDGFKIALEMGREKKVAKAEVKVVQVKPELKEASERVVKKAEENCPPCDGVILIDDDSDVEEIIKVQYESDIKIKDKQDERQQNNPNENHLDDSDEVIIVSESSPRKPIEQTTLPYTPMDSGIKLQSKPRPKIFECRMVAPEKPPNPVQARNEQVRNEYVAINEQLLKAKKLEKNGLLPRKRAMCFQTAGDELREWEPFMCFARRHEQEKHSALYQAKNKKLKICSKCDTNAFNEGVSVEALGLCQQHFLSSSASMNANGESLLVLPGAKVPESGKPTQSHSLHVGDQLKFYQFQAYCQQLARSFPHYASALNSRLWRSSFASGPAPCGTLGPECARGLSDVSRSDLHANCGVQKPAKI